MAKKILMLVGDYVEDYEVMVPFQALQMVGHTVHAVCPDKKAGEKVRTAIHDFEGDQTYSEKPGHNFTLNATFADVRAEAYDALVIPGGRAPEYLRLNRRGARDRAPLRRSRQADRRHLPRRAAAGRRRRARRAEAVSAYPAVPAGGRNGWRRVRGCADGPGPRADGNLVTAPAWPAHPAWLAQFLEVLGTRISRDLTRGRGRRRYSSARVTPTTPPGETSHV